MIPIIESVILGLIVGSTLTAIIPRFAAGVPWSRGRSHCPRCRHTLIAIDLVPILSFLWNRGSCRYCRGAIGFMYPAIELATAGLFVADVYLRSDGAMVQPDLWMTIAHDWFAIAVLIALFGIDLLAEVIPDAITLPSIVILAVWNVLLGADFGSLALGGVVGAGFFLIQYLVSRGKWIGGGDIRMGALLGVLLGWPVVLFALFISYLLGAGIGLGLIAVGNKSWKSRVPFGTFLAVGGVVSLFWGDSIVGWYLGTLV